MRSPSSLRKHFLKKWTMSLQACNTTNYKQMSMMERKKAIKLSADVAMASARNGTTLWSRAIISDASRDYHNKVLIERIITGCKNQSYKVNKKIACSRSFLDCKKINRSKKNVRRSIKGSKSSRARFVARRLVSRRMELLKRLVPGGESMDQCCLIEETLDYIISLKAQVDVMQSIANASMLVSSKY